MVRTNCEPPFPRVEIPRRGSVGERCVGPRLAAHTSASLTLVELANMMLGVELKAELGDEVDLGFKEIDVMFLVVHQLLEEFACHIVLHTVAVGCRLLVK